MEKVVIIGGGMAGLLSAIQLAKAGIPCRVLERRTYPFHRVCGEYISNEAVPFLKKLDLYPGKFNPPRISRLMLSAADGKFRVVDLEMGGFGISRFVFDEFLAARAVQDGVVLSTGTMVESVAFCDQYFNVGTDHGSIDAEVVIGAHGKRSAVDMRLDRDFTRTRSPWVGVKYHMRLEHPEDLIALHNFEGGYCGVSRVEGERVNVCYLVHRDQLRRYKSVDALENEVLRRNPLLREVFDRSVPLFDKPETINEISFARKNPVDQHVLMSGDAAGLIAPLCGNGMAMAIHSSLLLTECVVAYFRGNRDRGNLESRYSDLWNSRFRRRLLAGRLLQGMFGSRTGSRLAVGLALGLGPVTRYIIRQTHGDVF